MKITKKRLGEIIKEEARKLINEMAASESNISLSEKTIILGTKGKDALFFDTLKKVFLTASDFDSSSKLFKGFLHTIKTKDINWNNYDLTKEGKKIHTKLNETTVQVPQSFRLDNKRVLKTTAEADNASKQTLMFLISQDDNIKFSHEVVDPSTGEIFIDKGASKKEMEKRYSKKYWSNLSANAYFKQILKSYK